jgi:hypothetical protein
MHPLKKAYLKQGLTQEQLADLVNELKWRRPSGGLLTITPGAISQICTDYRECGKLLAKAFAQVLDTPRLTATLVLGNRKAA